MSDERFERLEELVTQLIQMVGLNNNSTNRLEGKFDVFEKRLEGLEQRFDGLEQRFDGFERKFETEKELNRLRHVELLKEIRYLSVESQYMQDKLAKHDLEIYKLHSKIDYANNHVIHESK